MGPEALLSIDVMEGIRPSWAGLPPREVAAMAEDVDGRSDEFPVTVQVRAHGDPAPARAWLTRQDGQQRLCVRLDEPQRGVAPGQTMVLYQGTRVLGQATIDAAFADRAAAAAS